MSSDLDTKILIRNAFRITRDRDLTCLRVRVPGGHLAARWLPLIQRIAEQFGNGTVHLTTRQGFEIPGIPFDRTDDVKKVLAEYIAAVETEQGVAVPQPAAGYPAAGLRNIAACIGNRVCQFANYDTTALALDVERLVYPHHFHVKIALTGCPNDCIKAHLQDFGIIGQADVQLEADRCIGCEACVKNCQARVTGALTMHHRRVRRDPLRCIGCGECVLKCPTGAWSRNPEKFYRLVVLGRTGKKNPRLAATFLEWVPREAVLGVIKNVFPFIEAHIDKSLDKEHLGYIVDRAGFPAFRDAVLHGIDIGPKGRVASVLEFAGYRYERSSALPEAAGDRSG